MKSAEFIRKNRRQKQEVAENASVGATASTAVSTSIGGGAGFGKSIFMKRMPKEKKGTKNRG